MTIAPRRVFLGKPPQPERNCLREAVKTRQSRLKIPSYYQFRAASCLKLHKSTCLR